MPAKLFDRCDISEWELGFEAGKAALDIPALKPFVPCGMAIEVIDLDQPQAQQEEKETKKHAA